MVLTSVGLKERVIRAGTISLFAFGSGQLLRLISNLLVSRIVTPTEFGLVAVAMAILVVLNLMSDVGLRQCIVRSPNGDSLKMLHTAWTIQIIRGLFIFIACCFIGLSLGVLAENVTEVGASVYSHPDLPYVISALGLTSLIAGFNTSRTYTAQRQLKMTRIAIVEIFSQVVSVASTLIVAYITPSVWAFVAGSIAGSVSQVILNSIVLSGPQDRVLFDRESASELLVFGRWVLLSSTTYVLASNADKLLLGSWFSPATMGLYSIAVALATLPEAVVSRLLGSIGLTALSEVHRNDPKEIRRVYYRIRLPLDLFVFGLSGFLYAVGPNLIAAMYDIRYHTAGSLLQLLSLSLVFARLNLDASLYMACGKPQYMSIMNLIKVASIFAILPVGYYFGGINGVAIGVSLVSIPVLPFVYWKNSRVGVLIWSREIIALPVWPAGFLVGQAFLTLFIK